ncbi:MAG: hypothetical protein ACXVC7_17000 [Bacteroidia bacterium]
MNKLILIGLLSMPLNANANEVQCLSKILYAEAENQSIEGIVALGESAINRAKRTNLSICKIHGVKRKQPDVRLRKKWEAVARSILKDNNKPIIADADSWVKGKIPSINHKDTKIRRVIGNHTFYLAGGKLI